MADFSKWRYCPHCGRQWSDKQIAQLVAGLGEITCSQCGCGWVDYGPKIKFLEDDLVNIRSAIESLWETSMRVIPYD